MNERNNLLIFCIALLVISIECISCNTPGTKNEKKAEPGAGPVVKESENHFKPTDTLVIDKPAALFFTADSNRREKIIKQFTAAQYDGMDHDCFYQMKNARTSLKEHWPQIKIYEITDTLYLQFTRTDGNKTGLDLREKKDLCGLVLFTPNKEPLLADMTNIGTFLENYFLR